MKPEWNWKSDGFLVRAKPQCSYLRCLLFSPWVLQAIWILILHENRSLIGCKQICVNSVNGFLIVSGTLPPFVWLNFGLALSIEVLFYKKNCCIFAYQRIEATHSYIGQHKWHWYIGYVKYAFLIFHIDWIDIGNNGCKYGTTNGWAIGNMDDEFTSAQCTNKHKADRLIEKESRYLYSTMEQKHIKASKNSSNMISEYQNRKNQSEKTEYKQCSHNSMKNYPRKKRKLNLRF